MKFNMIFSLLTSTITPKNENPLPTDLKFWKTVYLYDKYLV